MFRKSLAGPGLTRATSPVKRLLPPLGLIAAVFALQTLAGFRPDLVERYYSRGIFPLVARAFSFAGLISFSLAESLLALLTAAVIVWLALIARRLCKRRSETRSILLSALTSALWASGVGFAVFMLVFGLNYRRQPVADTFRLAQRDPTPAEIVAVSRDVVDGVNRNYAESGAKAEEGRGSVMPLSKEELYSVIEAAYRAEPLLRGASASRVEPKPVYLSGLLSRLGVSGIYSPFTGEPNYNSLQTDCDLPFTIAHEMAHQRGFAREDEANFIAFLVCTKATHPYVRYSGYLGALRVLGVLLRVAPASYREVVSALGEGPRADLKARAQFWSRYAGRLGNFGQGINNVYLKVNGVRSGVRNYNEASALVVGYYLKQMAAGLAAD